MATKTERKQQAQCPQNEEKRPFVIGLVAAGTARWFQAQRGHCGQRTQWKVDPEDRAPAGILRHKAAGDWAYDACKREHRSEPTLKTAALLGRQPPRQSMPEPVSSGHRLQNPAGNGRRRGAAAKRLLCKPANRRRRTRATTTASCGGHTHHLGGRRWAQQWLLSADKL